MAGFEVTAEAAIPATFEAHTDPASETLGTWGGEYHCAENQSNEDDSNPNSWLHSKRPPRATLY